MFKVINPGAHTVFQDVGRHGLAGTGVCPSGSFDRMSAARANHAMGNDPRATVLECLVGGLVLEALQATQFIVCGVRCPIVISGVDGRVRQSYSNTIIDLEAGERLDIGTAESGMRGYLAIRGGFAAESVLGSRATDIMSGLGPAPVKAGDVLLADSLIAEPAWWPTLRQLPTLWPLEEVHTLSVVLGPRADWFTEDSITDFFSQTYQVSPQSNRIGIRLEGSTPLTRAVSRELSSEGMVRGSIQVPPNGMPVIFGPDHPVTGGYPVTGVLTRRSSDYSGQIAPGESVRFQRAT